MLLLAVALFPACAMQWHIERDAVAYNRTVEQVKNQVLLLNIVRAMKRRPMHVTALSQIRGSFSNSIGTNVTFPFIGGSSEDWATSINGSTKTSPSFDVAILDSRKFMQGFLSPVETRVIKYFFDQGWRREILLYLFVRRIEVRNKDGSLHHAYLNYPGETECKACKGNTERKAECKVCKGKTAYERFREFVGDPNQWRIREISSRTRIGPDLKKGAQELEHLVEVQKAGLTVSNQTQITFDRWTKAQTATVKWTEESKKAVKKDDVLGHVAYGKKKDGIKKKDEIKAPAGGVFTRNVADETAVPENGVIGTIKSKTYHLEKRSTSFKAEPDPESKAGVAKQNGKELRIFIRSPEAILYYLGEILREQVAGRDFGQVRIMTEGVEWPLFVAHKGSAPSDAIVQVRHDGETYYIANPKKKPSRAMHCLTLVTQLLGLHQEADELPTTAAVTLTGG
jgi:hypothetical protein